MRRYIFATGLLWVVLNCSAQSVTNYLVTTNGFRGILTNYLSATQFNLSVTPFILTNPPGSTNVQGQATNIILQAGTNIGITTNSSNNWTVFLKDPLKDSVNTQALNVANRSLVTSNGTTSVKWNTRTLLDSIETNSIDWNLRQLLS